MRRKRETAKMISKYDNLQPLLQQGKSHDVDYPYHQQSPPRGSKKPGQSKGKKDLMGQPDLSKSERYFFFFFYVSYRRLLPQLGRPVSFLNFLFLLFFLLFSCYFLFCYFILYCLSFPLLGYGCWSSDWRVSRWKRRLGSAR